MPNEPTPASDSGQKSEPASKEEPGQPTPPAVDEQGVSYFNRFKEQERKTQEAVRDRDEARGNVMEVNKRFDDFMSAVRNNQQWQGPGSPGSTPPNPLGLPPTHLDNPEQRTFPPLGQPNPLVAPTPMAPTSPVNPQGQPVPAAPGAVTFDQMRNFFNEATATQSAVNAYQTTQAEAETTLRGRYPDLNDPKSEASREFEYRLAQKTREYQHTLGVLAPPDLKLTVANEMVLSGKLNPGTVSGTTTPAIQGNGEPVPPQEPAPQPGVPGGTDALETAFVADLKEAGLSEDEARAAWKRTQEDPNMASYKYKNNLKMNWGRK